MKCQDNSERIACRNNVSNEDPDGHVVARSSGPGYPGFWSMQVLEACGAWRLSGCIVALEIRLAAGSRGQPAAAIAHGSPSADRQEQSATAR
jgi:hypothetical protein